MSSWLDALPNWIRWIIVITASGLAQAVVMLIAVAVVNTYLPPGPTRDVALAASVLVPLVAVPALLAVYWRTRGARFDPDDWTTAYDGSIVPKRKPGSGKPGDKD